VGHPLERRNLCDAFADDQGMDVVGASAGFYGLQVGHVAEDGVLVGDAVAAEDVASHRGALQGHLDVVTLRHRNMVGVLPCPHPSTYPLVVLVGRQSLRSSG